MLLNLSQVEGFEWDQGNLDKNWKRHNVTTQECEELFVNDPLIFPDPEHSYSEKRFAVYGVTNSGRRLTIVFTWRGSRIRIVSARDQSRRERRSYKF